jgi:uncharacterized protein (TIGR02246 family)
MEERHKEDLAQIEKLHEMDMKASKEQNYDTLLSLCTQDCVMLPADQEPIIGIEAIKKWMKQNQAASENLQVTEYIQDFKEIKIIGDWAFEWGTYQGEAISMEGGETIKQSGKLMRILKRQPDGSWVVARSIWNTDGPFLDK